MTAAGRTWLLITTRANWERLSKRGQWVFAARAKAKTVARGDEAVVYLTQEGGRGVSSVAGHVRFTGDLRHAEDGAFGTLYPWAIDLEVLAEAEPPVAFKPLKDQLSFIPRSPNWGSALQGQPIKEIPRADFELLAGLVRQQTGRAIEGRR